MDIFESLENLQVSEACFEDIIGIVETLVGRFAEKGAPVTGNEEEFKKEMAPLVRTKKELARRKTQAGVEASKKIGSDLKNAGKELDKASDTYNKASEKEQQAYKDYKEAQEGSDLQKKLFDKWGKLLDKSVHAGQKHSDAWDKKDEIESSRANLEADVTSNEKKAHELQNLLADIKGKGLENTVYNYPRYDKSATHKIRQNMWPKK